MASPTLSPRAKAHRRQPPPLPSLGAGGGPRRRWSLALASLLVTVGSALAFAVLWMNAGDRQPVLALRRDVAAGQVITADDLAVVRVASDSGVDPVGSAAREDVVGQAAAVDLLAGSLLVPSAVGDAQGLDRGTVMIAVPLAPEEMPSTDLRVGDRVVLYRTAATDGERPADTIGSGRVASVDHDEDGEGTPRVSVVVSDELAPEVAAAVQADQASLALAPRGD